MAKTEDINFAEPKQDRAKKTLDDLLETALELVNEGEIELLTSRTLSKKSGYSLGTLNKRLNSVDKIFLWAIKQGQQKHLEKISKIIEGHDPTLPIDILLEKMIKQGFESIMQVNPSIIKFYENRINKFSNQINAHQFSDVLVKPFLQAMEQDRTGTFRKMSESELRLITRMTYILLERPFVDRDPIAGSEEHHRIVLDNFLRILGSKMV